MVLPNAVQLVVGVPSWLSSIFQSSEYIDLGLALHLLVPAPITVDSTVPSHTTHVRPLNATCVVADSSVVPALLPA